MLHILLTILKLIGIILAAVLGIVLLLLLIVLFVPIRYQAEASKTEEAIQGDVTISWLFKALRVDLRLLNKDFNYEIKILGISLNKILEFFNKFKKEKITKTVESSEIKNNAETVVIEQKDGDNKSEDQSNELQTADSTSLPNENNKEESRQSSDAISEQDNVNNQKDKVVNKQKSKAANNKNNKAVSKQKKKETSEHKQKNLRLTIESTCDKIKYWINFIREEHTKGSLSLIKKHLIKILKHILPKKIKGNVIYGMEDPSKTGQILAGICVFYPMYYKHINISPDFTQAVLLGDIDIKGRIYLAFIVKTGIVVFFDKNIQYVWKQFKK